MIKRAEIFIILGMKSKAINDIQAASIAIDELPSYKLKTPYFQKLIKQMNEMLNNLN